MGKVVVSSDYRRLKTLLINEHEQYSYVLIDNYNAEGERFLRENGCARIDINEGLGGIDFRKEYIDFIGSLNRRYSSIYWFANSISYKGTFVSDLFQEIFNYYCVTQLLKETPHNYIILTNNHILANNIKKYCDLNAAECILFLKTRDWYNKISYLRKYLVSNIYFLFIGWFRKTLVFLYLDKRIKRALRRQDTYLILKTWLEKRSFANDKYNDLFFGELPGFLLKYRNKSFFILGGIFNDYASLVKKIKQANEFLIIPQEYFVSYLDYLRVIGLVFINRPKIVNPLTFLGLEVSDFVQGHLIKDYAYNEINKNLIYYYYAKGLIKKVKVGEFIFTFENHAWEKILTLAFKKYSPRTKMIGYVHSSVRQSLINFFCSKEEKDIVPLPDKIITVGREPRRILEERGNYSEKVLFSEGCALRYEYLFKNRRIGRNKNGKILVAFPIDINYSLCMLRFIHNALAGDDKYEVLLRPHPLTPLEEIIKKDKLKLGRNFEISRNANLVQDLKSAVLLLYFNSTTSIEALMCGVPGVYLNFKGLMNSDPLFNLNSFKWSVSNGDELRDTIDYIYNMSDEEFLRRHSEAVSYIKGYFNPVEEVYLKEFLA